jgi:subtilisin family serine protease
MQYQLKNGKRCSLFSGMLILVLAMAGCIPQETGMIAEDIAGDTSVVPCYVSLHPVDAADIWKISEGNTDIPVAVLDTGVDTNHPLLQDKIIEEINFSNSDTLADRHGHGTHIAALIASIDLHNPILSVKVAEDNGVCRFNNVARGIQWAADNGAKVINLSLAFNKSDPVLESAVDYAWQKGCILVAAAGNTPGADPIYPAFYPGCIAVTATDDFGEVLQFARSGDWVAVSAPGQDISSALPSDQCGLKSGTSQATAYVSAVSALMAGLVSDSNGNGLTNDEVYRIILESDGQSDGPAFLDALKFLREAKNCDALIAELNATIVQHPDDYEAYLNRGKLFLVQDDLTKALADFQFAVSLKL